MKKITLILVLVAVAVFTNQAFSMEKRPVVKKTTTKAAPEVLQISGKVSGYNWSNSTITVSANSGSSLVISADKNTSISKAKKYIKLTDIKNGDIVAVTYESKRGVNTAKWIIVQEKVAPATNKSNN